MPADGDLEVVAGVDDDEGDGIRGRVRRAYGRRQNQARSMGQLQSEQARLAARVSRLEAELAQERRLQRRVAELVDVVQQLLLPRDDSDDSELRQRLEVYAEEI